MKTAPRDLLLGFLLLASAPMAAAQQPADRLEAIVDQQRTLAADIDAKRGLAADLTPRQANIVRRAQQDVFAVTEGKSSMEDLSIDQKVRLDNALERINAEVKGGGRVATGETDVCWRERKSGSSVKVTRCGTKAERDQIREGARDFIEKPRVCNPPGCG